ncbi:MAG TPA: hypothetical protein DCO72_06420 [Ruminococcus sp.]|nr:hypothetical protein [Ruminococcus sp.]
MRKLVTLTISCLMAVCLFLNCSLVSKNLVAKADVVSGLYPSIYYRLKNVASNLYITMDSYDDLDNVSCSLQPRSAHDARQIFRLIPSGSTNTYFLKPMTSSKPLCMSTLTNGHNPLMLKTYYSIIGYWKIAESSNGHKITSVTSNLYNVVSPFPNSYNADTPIATNTFQGIFSTWGLEPAFSGSAEYYVTTSDILNNPENNACVNEIVGKIENLGYDTSRYEYPNSGALQNRIGQNRFCVVHGHGSPGALALENASGNVSWLYADNISLVMPMCSYCMIISCNSAVDSTHGNLTEKLHQHGVGCVTGFTVSVSKGEYYFKYVLHNQEFFPDNKIIDSLACVDLSFGAAYNLSGTNPANPNHRLTVGSTSVSLGLN